MCADITACEDKRCPSRTYCYRYTCVKSTFQSYFVKSPRKPHAMRCSEFWDNELDDPMVDPDPSDDTVSFGKHKYPHPLCACKSKKCKDRK